MSTSSYDSTFSLGASRLVVPVGVTAGLLVLPIEFQNTLRMTLLTGGTCEIIGSTQGQTLSGAQLATLSGGGYPLPLNTEVLVPGPARFYLQALGATSTIALRFDRSETTTVPSTS